MPTEAIIRAEGVTKIFNPGEPDEMIAVRGVSLTVKGGETLVLKGPSGSGKTSLLGLLGCMARPTEGLIEVEGRDVAKLPERFLTEVRRSTFGFIFQQFNLIKGVSVLENVMLPLYPTGRQPADIKRRALETLDRLDLGRKAGVKAHRLSGGEQQRVAIARALVAGPRILLADEPTAHLDTRLSEDLIAIIRSLSEEGKTIVIATHDPLVADGDFVHRTIEMRDGSIVAPSAAGA